MARKKEMVSRSYIGTSVSPEMLQYIKGVHIETGIGNAEYLRRLIKAEIARQHGSTAGIATAASEANFASNCIAMPLNSCQQVMAVDQGGAV